MKRQFTQIDGWQDFTEMLVAIWLLSSPFVLGFVSNTAATVTALLAGCLVMLFSVMGMSTHEIADEWLSLIVGVALIASPWVLGYAVIELAMINALICGFLFCCLTVITIFGDYRVTHQQKAKIDTHHPA